MVGRVRHVHAAQRTHYTDLDINDDKSNGGKGGVAMAEVYEYFAGITAYAGHNKLKTDYTRVFTNGTMAGPTYLSPQREPVREELRHRHQQRPVQDNTSDTSQASPAQRGRRKHTTINPPDNGTSNNNAADEWVRS